MPAGNTVPALQPDTLAGMVLLGNGDGRGQPRMEMAEVEKNKGAKDGSEYGHSERDFFVFEIGCLLHAGMRSGDSCATLILLQSTGRKKAPQNPPPHRRLGRTD